MHLSVVINDGDGIALNPCRWTIIRVSCSVSCYLPVVGLFSFMHRYWFSHRHAFILILCCCSYCGPFLRFVRVFFSICLKDFVFFWTLPALHLAFVCIFGPDMLVLNPLDLHSCVFDCIINGTCSVRALFWAQTALSCMLLSLLTQCVYDMETPVLLQSVLWSHGFIRTFQLSLTFWDGNSFVLVLRVRRDETKPLKKCH